MKPGRAVHICESDDVRSRSRKVSKVARAFMAIGGILCLIVVAKTAFADGGILIRNVTLLSGEDAELVTGQNVLVHDNTIKAIFSASGAKTPEVDLVIDGGGRILMPGLIDTHTHLSFVGPLDEMTDWSWEYIGVQMSKRAEATLMRGFTTVRDLGGPVVGLKRAIDEGLVVGPRIYPSGAFLTQTGGHADMRSWTDLNPRWSGHSTNWERLGFYRTTDGVEEVLTAVRENLAHGATQIKIMGSGGMGSEFDPIDAIQFTFDEMRAAVQAASDWDTYVAAHLQNGPAIERALEAGILSIDHGNGIEESGMALLVKKDAFFNTHFAAPRITLEYTAPEGNLRVKAQEVIDQIDDMVRLIQKHQPKVTYCSDSFGPQGLWERIQTEEILERKKIFKAEEVFRQATTVAAELLALSGARNPYPGKIGVIEEGALADILIIEGNLLNDIGLLAEPEKNIALIMKDGNIYKNNL